MAALLICASMANLLYGQSATVMEELSGTVIGISDGDTIKVLVNEQQFRVRLEGIDAPEKPQSFSAKAHDVLAQLVFRKEVTVRTTGTDRYGRVLGVVIIDGINVNRKLIEDGWAWHFKTYNDDVSRAVLI